MSCRSLQQVSHLTVSLPERYISFARIILFFSDRGGCSPPSPPAPYADAGSYILVFLSTLTVFFRSRKKNNVKERKKRSHSPLPPPSQLIFSLRLIKGKLSPRWVLIWAFRVFSLGVFSCDWWKAQTKAKCNSCALDSEHLSNPTIPSDRAIVRERKNKSGKKILFHAMEGTSSGGYYREFCSKWNWCKKYFNQ